MSPIELASLTRGYRRDADLQRAFDDAAGTLRGVHGRGDEGSAFGGMPINVVLEGGGVKGIALVGALLVLEEAGFTIERVAGTSAGAVVGSITAALRQSGRDLTSLVEYLRSLEFSKFMPEGRLHELLDHAGGRFAGLIADAAHLTNREGLYSGEYLEAWLRPILAGLGVHSFADLRLDTTAPASAERVSRLLVYVSDITRGRLARLPSDFPLYGLDANAQDPVLAVHASMAIPFFFEPVHVAAEDATMHVELPGAGPTTVHFAGGRHTWVDGGLLAKYPIHSFDDSSPERSPHPTVGIKLSRLQTEYTPGGTHRSALAIAVHCLKTLVSEWDALSTHVAVANRTIFVDGAVVGSTDFDLTEEQEDHLFLAGVRAATQFVIDVAATGGLPDA